MIPGRHRMGLVAGAALGAIALAMALVSLACSWAMSETLRRDLVDVPDDPGRVDARQGA